MASPDAFADKFRQLLKSIPDDYTLGQWQESYRQAIFLMGMRILERFESEAIAQQSHHEERRLGGGETVASPEITGVGFPIQIIASHGGGSGGGGNPSFFMPCHCRVFPDYPLALQPPEIKGRERSKK